MLLVPPLNPHLILLYPLSMLLIPPSPCYLYPLSMLRIPFSPCCLYPLSQAIYPIYLSTCPIHTSLLDAIGNVPQKMTVSVRRNMGVLMGKKHVLDKKVLEGLQFALYEVFFEIKSGSWMPFSESDVFASLLQRKEGTFYSDTSSLFSSKAHSSNTLTLFSNTHTNTSSITHCLILQYVPPWYPHSLF